MWFWSTDCWSRPGHRLCLGYLSFVWRPPQPWFKPRFSHFRYFGRSPLEDRIRTRCLRTLVWWSKLHLNWLLVTSGSPWPNSLTKSLIRSPPRGGNRNVDGPEGLIWLKIENFQLFKFLWLNLKNSNFQFMFFDRYWSHIQTRTYKTDLQDFRCASFPNLSFGVIWWVQNQT